MMMKFLLRNLIFTVLSIYSINAAGLDIKSTPIGENLNVYPGDRFYIEGEQTPAETIQLSDSFTGKMPGSLKIPFNFSVNTTTLYLSTIEKGWKYYSAPQGLATAWHGIIGNVLASGDTVGIRIRQKDNLIEWFVNNSYHNYPLKTIYHRKHDTASDPKVSSIKIVNQLKRGSKLRALEYLGIRDNQLRIRYSENDGTTSIEDEFLFPIEKIVPILIGIKGLRGEVSQINGASVSIKILRGFDTDNFANPLN